MKHFFIQLYHKILIHSKITKSHIGGVPNFENPINIHNLIYIYQFLLPLIIFLLAACTRLLFCTFTSSSKSTSMPSSESFNLNFPAIAVALGEATEMPPLLLKAVPFGPADATPPRPNKINSQ